MNSHKKMKYSVLSRACAALLGTTATFAQAEEGSSVEEERKEPIQLEAMTVVGSRFAPRSSVDSPVPVDTISAEELQRGSGTDLQSRLKTLVPSFSTPRPSAGGTQDFLTPPTMRGLSPGQMLLLVNGKRRHTSPELNSSNQIGRGDIAYDFNAIPAAAIKQVEVLRDGAAAQYGSDAIAGVMNLQLDDSLGFAIQGQYGQTTKGDGEHTEISIGQGWALGEIGFVRLTAQYQDHKHTDRAQPDTRQQYLGSDGTVLPSSNYGSGTGLTSSSGVLDPREASIDRNMWTFGEPDYRNKSVFLNSAIPVNDTVEAYAFGGYNELDGTSYMFARRAGQDETVRALHPDGYQPTQSITLENSSFAAGLRGSGLYGFDWDLSTHYAGAENHAIYHHSNNVSYGLDSPTDFNRGTWEFRQLTTNLDLRRSLPVGDSSPLNLAFGLEHRREFYALGAGDPASYLNGGAAILDGPNAGNPGAVGAQPSGGITPEDASRSDRTSKAVYVELEKEFADRLLLTAAARYEDFSDFGETANYRLAGRFRLTDGLAIRGSYGTGFRAPALAQTSYAQSYVTYVNGEPVKIRSIKASDPLAPLVGATDLKPEESENLSFGLAFSRNELNMTLDFYQIRITDRIVMSSDFTGRGLTTMLAEHGYTDVSTVSYLTNAVDTTTRGVDLTTSYHRDLGGFGKLTTTLAANSNRTHFDRIAGTPEALAALGISTALVDLTQQVRLSESMPQDKVALTLDWSKGPWSVAVTGTRYGEVAQVALTNRTPAQVAALTPGYDVRLVPSVSNPDNRDIIQVFGADIVTDLVASYAFSSGVKVSLGASNLFDVFPDKNIASTPEGVAAGSNGSDNYGIFPYAYIAPYGTAGRFVYMKIGYSF